MDADHLLRLKAISLGEMKHSPWTDSSRFMAGEKNQLIKLMQHKHETLTADEVTAEFNILVNDRVFYQGCDVSRIPVLR